MLVNRGLNRLIVLLFLLNNLQGISQVVVNDDYFFSDIDDFDEKNSSVTKPKKKAVINKKYGTKSHVFLSLLCNNLKIHELSRFSLLTIQEVKLQEEITFFNHLGILVRQEANIIPRNNTIVLDLSSFTEGIYFLKFKNHGVIKRIKIN